jgi:hypothetical protein
MSSGRKTEPVGRSYTPGVVSQIGESLGNHATDQTKILHGTSAPMYEEGVKTGFMAPKPGVTIHDCGSQGKR